MNQKAGREKAVAHAVIVHHEKGDEGSDHEHDGENPGRSYPENLALRAA